MRLRDFLIGTTLISLGLVNANARALDDEAKRQMTATQPKALTEGGRVSAPPLPPPPSPLVRDDAVLGGAYYDTWRILSSENSCSDFFGGSTKAVVVLNSLMGRVAKEYLPGSIGMRMSGEIITVRDAPTNTNFRLFDKVAINAKGPFYRQRTSSSEATMPRLGNYEPNTKEVRALILLHELGHLIKGDDGNWLLPDDGRSQEKSRDNSAKIEDVCGDQIKGLARSN